MATRTYQTPEDFNIGLGQFTFETSVEGFHYLKIGGLTESDLSLVRSLPPIGDIGFFQDGVERDNTAILAMYDSAAGLRVETIPDLQTGAAYQIYLPASTRTGDGVSLDEAEHIAQEYDDAIIVTGPGVTYTGINRATTILKSYVVGSRQPTRFVAEWYANKQDYINGIQQTAAEAPTNVSFDPATPATTRGQHQVVISFTPQARASRINPAVLKFEVV